MLMKNKRAEAPRGIVARLVGVGLCFCMIGLPLSAAGPSAKTVVSPEVKHTGAAPTGYEVTFRYYAPDAKKVQIKGEWYFERPSALAQYSGDPKTPVIESPGLLPTEWQPGDTPLAHPNSTDPNWPVADMKKGPDGVWTYTIPLPSGIFTYRFYVDAPDDLSNAKSLPDPNNKAWNEAGAAVIGMSQVASQVYVPSDPVFHTIDYWWQAPAAKKGELHYHAFTSDRANGGSGSLVVYTPPSYDSKRAKPYPTLYLSHGGGENEFGWTTQGVAQNILDNLISIGKVEPMVVVMPNASVYSFDNFYDAYDRDLIEKMIPLVEKNYRVSPSADYRAFSGLSLGGMLTNTFIVKYPETFKYYGMMSAGLPPEYEKLTAAQAAALKGKSIFIGAAWQDPIALGWALGQYKVHTGPFLEVKTLTEAGIPVVPDFIDGGHNWNVWRQLFADFLTHVAFKPLPYASWDASSE